MQPEPLAQPTAEQVFADWPGVECTSAGTNQRAENPLAAELVEWAELIFVMEETHRDKVRAKFRAQFKDKRLIVLGIPDDYDFMDAALVDLLRAKVPRFLPDA